MADQPTPAADLPLAVDAMGGDQGPTVVVEGALQAVQAQGGRVALVGRRAELAAALAALGAAGHPAVELVDAEDVITMHDSPVDAVREKARSSLVVAARLVREGKAAALISPANTGAVLAAGTLLVGRSRGVERPGIATVMPSRSGFTILIDVGANSDSRPTHLLQFGIMGAVYARAILGIAEPRIGLLSIGEEKSKGNELVKEAFPLFESFFAASGRYGRFLGNVEGREVFNGRADVVACDGFTGNAILKSNEACAYMIMDLLKDRLTANPFRKAAAACLQGAFREFKKRIDYTEYGGAPLLGVKQPTIICHGSSGAKAIRSALRVAREAIDKKICQVIQESVAAATPDENRRIG